MARAIDDTLAANKLTDAYIRLVVTRGAGSLGLDPRKTTDPQVIIITDAISLYPDELYEHGLKIITAGTMRNHPNAAQPADQVAQLPEQHPGQDRGDQRRLPRSPDAQPQGRGRRVHRRQHLRRPQGRAAHARRSTPGILEGITRDAVIELAREAGHHGRRADDGPARRLHRRRVLPDRHRRRGDPGRRVRRPRRSARASRARSPATCASGSTRLVRGER